MKLLTKKIIAREFLILMTLILSGLVILGIIYSINMIRKNQVYKLYIEITYKNLSAQKLERQLKKKVDAQDLFKKQLNNANFDTTGVWTRLSHFAQSDSIDYYWKNVWTKEVIDFTNRIGYPSSKELENFIEVNTIDSTDIINRNHSISIRNGSNALIADRNRIKSKVLTFRQQINLTLWISTILFILLFIVRYLIYSIIWSLRIIKKNSD